MQLSGVYRDIPIGSAGEGEYDEADYQKILQLQMRAAIVCDDHPELQEKTAQ